MLGCVVTDTEAERYRLTGPSHACGTFVGQAPDQGEQPGVVVAELVDCSAILRKCLENPITFTSLARRLRQYRGTNDESGKGRYRVMLKLAAVATIALTTTANMCAGCCAFCCAFLMRLLLSFACSFVRSFVTIMYDALSFQQVDKQEREEEQARHDTNDGDDDGDGAAVGTGTGMGRDTDDPAATVGTADAVDGGDGHNGNGSNENSTSSSSTTAHGQLEPGKQWMQYRCICAGRSLLCVCGHGGMRYHVCFCCFVLSLWRAFAVSSCLVLSVQSPSVTTT